MVKPGTSRRAARNGGTEPGAVGAALQGWAEPQSRPALMTRSATTLPQSCPLCPDSPHLCSHLILTLPVRSLRRWPCPHHIVLGPPAPIHLLTTLHTNDVPSSVLDRWDEVNRRNGLALWRLRTAQPLPCFQANLPPGSPRWAGVRPSGKPICDRSSLGSTASQGPELPSEESTGNPGQSDGSSKRCSSLCPCRLGSPQLQRAHRRAGPLLWTHRHQYRGSSTPQPHNPMIWHTRVSCSHSWKALAWPIKSPCAHKALFSTNKLPEVMRRLLKPGTPRTGDRDLPDTQNGKVWLSGTLLLRGCKSIS